MTRALLVVALLVPALVRAQAEELENPGSVAAVQERKYRLDHELDLGLGVLPLDAFYKGLTVQVGYTFHFSDAFAWRVGRGAYSYTVNTNLRNQLERDFGVLPTAFREVKWFVGSDLVWSPFYGKTTFLNQRVLHFEVFGILGGSIVNLDVAGQRQFKPAANLGLGARLFRSDRVSFKLELTDNVVIDTDLLQVPSVHLSASLNFGGAE